MDCLGTRNTKITRKNMRFFPQKFVLARAYPAIADINTCIAQMESAYRIVCSRITGCPRMIERNTNSILFTPNTLGIQMESGAPNSLKSVKTMGRSVKIGYSIAKQIPMIRLARNRLDITFPALIFASFILRLTAVLFFCMFLIFVNDFHRLQK